MPGIVAFRRRWSVGSDDLVVPGIFLFTLHLIWVVVLVVLLAAVHFDRTVECVFLLWEYLLGYLAILVGSLLLELFISVVAMRGSILDTAPRASMQYLLYVRLSVMGLEMVWLSLGVVWLTRHYQDCPIERAKQAVMGIVICNWCVLLSVLITVWCTFDAAGRSWVKMKEYQRSMRESESRFQYKRSGSRHRNWRQRKVIRAYQDSWNHRCRLLFCCMGNSDRNRNSFADIARLLSDFFRDLDVVPSDVVAGLVLLRKFQKIEREAIVKQRKNDTYEYLSGVAVTSQTQFLALNDPTHFEHFQSVIHYMHFALGAYGWPMFLITHSGTGVCQLCAKLRCSCFPCIGHNDTAVIVEDNCCQCNYAALRKMVEVGEVEIIYATYHVDVGETPFFVAVDFSRKTVVISIRGTLSLQDVITDLNAEGEPLPLSPPKEDWLGHKGMVQAAEYIHVKLKEESILAAAFELDDKRGTRDFRLVIVGHSLGAGTASILAILLRQEYPNLQCFSYSPPGGTLSMPAVEYTKSFITSVVLGKDVVPRIGLHQLESLRADLINTIKRSKDPKWKTIFCSVVCCGCAPIPTSAAELQASSMIEYQKEKDAARDVAMHPSDSSIALTVHQPLYPPGKIIHIVRHHPTKGEQMLNKHEPVYQAVWANTTDFDEVLISPVMIQDHMPDNVLDALNKVITTIGPAKPQRTLSNNNSTVTSAEHLDSERCHLLASNNIQPGSPKAVTPPHKLCLETSFTSLQSPSSDTHQNPSLHSSICSQHKPLNGTSKTTNNHISSPFALHPVLSWEYASILEEQLMATLHSTSTGNGGKINEDQKALKVDLIHDDWFGLAPLATPESLSEVSSISSRASSLVLNIDRTWKDMFGYQKGLTSSYIPSNTRRLLDSPVCITSLPSPTDIPSARYLKRGPNILGSLAITVMNDSTTRMTNSSTDDLSFESARQMSSEDNSNNGTSSDVFVSVKGTPFSSIDSVTVNADVHSENPLRALKSKTDSPASLPCNGSRRPASVAAEILEGQSINYSPKQVKFLTPQNSLNNNKHLAMEIRNKLDSYHGVTSPDKYEIFPTAELHESNQSLEKLKYQPCSIYSKEAYHKAAPLSQEHRHNTALATTMSRMGRHVYSPQQVYERNLKEYDIVNKKVLYVGDVTEHDLSSSDTSPITDDNSFCSSSTGNNNVRDFKLPSVSENTALFKKHNGDMSSFKENLYYKMNGKDFSEAEEAIHQYNGKRGKAGDIVLSNTSATNSHLHTLESLPLLSSIGEVQDKSVRVRKKYAYPITSVGKGESSV